MQLWLLLPRAEVLARPVHPWTPPYDKTFGVLVRAETEADARRLAQAKSGHEGLGVYRKLGASEDEIAADAGSTPPGQAAMSPGEPGVILVRRQQR